MQYCADLQFTILIKCACKHKICVDLCQVTVIIFIYKWTGARLKYEKNMTLVALQHNELHAIGLKIASHTEK